MLLLPVGPLNTGPDVVVSARALPLLVLLIKDAVAGTAVCVCWCRGNPGDPSADMTWSKWSFWLVHALIATLIYATILILPFTQWRDLLPAKSSFYGYVRCLLLVYTCLAVGAILIGSKLLAGYCIYGIANWLYYAAYPPVVYLTFLADFFADDQLDMDLLYYSEMRDAGCFEDGYDEY
jgi:hypothetical protein